MDAKSQAVAGLIALSYEAEKAGHGRMLIGVPAWLTREMCTAWLEKRDRQRAAIARVAATGREVEGA